MKVDIAIIGAGPAGLMCAHLAKMSGLSAVVIDKSEGPLKVGRADALNARTLQFMEIAGLFDEIYPSGLPCNTSSVFKDGEFISRQSSWWDELEGCEHKHFLMIGQAHIEQLLDRKLGKSVLRSKEVVDVDVTKEKCITTLKCGKKIESAFLIGADGARSMVRNKFGIDFKIERPEITWAVIDAEIKTDFPTAPEIIVFQTESNDVAWIPREGKIDRFYVRMESKEFELDQVVSKINRAMKPHTLDIEELVWFSQFSVKESVADKYRTNERVFLAGDACHVHSVNGGQGLNTGLADAFNLIWKINQNLNGNGDEKLLDSYERERKPVAQSVIETSGELVRKTKFSESGNHALEYVDIVKKRSGNITGMGIAYPGQGLVGKRLHDQKLGNARLYNHLRYDQFNLVVYTKSKELLKVPSDVNLIIVPSDKESALLVRPDSYIQSELSIAEINPNMPF